jgi:hypothetical protein
MKKGILTALFFLTWFFDAWSQEDFRLVKIDNSEYPVIEVFIRTDQGINPNEIIVKENGKDVKIAADTIPAREIYKGRSILKQKR